MVLFDCQKGGRVVWDYHVFLLLVDRRGVNVYDFDTTLGFPTPFNAEEAVESFSSDRSHMIQDNGEFSMPPPAYPPLRGSTAEGSHDLPALWTMNSPYVPQVGDTLKDLTHGKTRGIVVVEARLAGLMVAEAAAISKEVKDVKQNDK